MISYLFGQYTINVFASMVLHPVSKVGHTAYIKG